MNRRIAIDWEVGHAPSAGQAPGRWVPSTVPGAVQLDWARAEGWPSYWMGSNCTSYRWMEDVWWTYRAKLDRVRCGQDERLILVCGGVDYDFAVAWEGEVIFVQEGMFTPFELDLTDMAHEGGCLEIRLHPVPKAPAERDDQQQARLSAKPAVAYGWDWHPRLIPLGIWEDTYLEVRPAAHWLECDVTYALDAGLQTATLQVSVAATSAANETRWRWALADPADRNVIGGGGWISGGSGQDSVRLEKVSLWWPHDRGGQPLYTATFELLDADGSPGDFRSVRLGFRRVRLVMHEGAWDLPLTKPASRNPPPITVEINGRPIFAKGANWVPPEIFPGTITAQTYRPLLELVRGAHMNLVRSWGGGIVNKEVFFDLCDELGILVWQEFPLACNAYGDDPGYLKVLDRESRSIVRRIRRHPCLAIWCGGNELFNSWSRMTDQSLALRLLNRNCLDLDPSTPFLPTSPLDGMGHGDYRFRDDGGREVHQIFAQARKTAYPEFGCPGPSSVDYLKRFIPEPELWPPRPGTAWETHHGLGAWSPSPTSWLCLDVLQHYFGEAADLATLVARGQWLQVEGYKVIYEEARRQWPMCSMALNWCLNEPWPTAANNSIVNWPADPKPAYYAVAGSCRPTLVSARIPKFSWHEGERFSAEAWLLNDSLEAVPAGRVTADLIVGSQMTRIHEWAFSGLAPERNQRGPDLHGRLPIGAGVDRFTLRLDFDGRPDWSSAYTMILVPESPPDSADVREARSPAASQETSP